MWLWMYSRFRNESNLRRSSQIYSKEINNITHVM